MTVLVLFLVAALGIVMFPMLIPYLLLIYMALDGLASRTLMFNLKVTVGGTNIFFTDLLYAATVILAVFGMLRILMNGSLGSYAPTTKKIIFLVVCYIMFFVGKLINGYLDSVPIDTLVRRFALDTQCIYFFIPLFFIKKEKILKQLLYTVVVISLLFPLAQPFLYGSADQVALELGQGGTLRLGSGNANILLMLGALALFVWDRKIWLAALPLAGIAMLAQRSAFVSLTLCIMVLSFQKKKSMKFIILIGVACALLIATLVVIQATSSVPVVEKAAERIGQTFEKTGTTKARMDVLPVILGAYAEKPFIGFSYRDMYGFTLKQDRDAFAFNMLHPHSFVFSALLRTGTIGTIILFVIIALVMKAAWRLSRQKETKEKGMYLLSTNLFFIVFGLMNTTFNSAGDIYWVLAGITLWYLNNEHQTKQQQIKHQQRSIEQ